MPQIHTEQEEKNEFIMWKYEVSWQKVHSHCDHLTFPLWPLETKTVLGVFVKDKCIGKMRWGRFSNVSGTTGWEQREESLCSEDTRIIASGPFSHTGNTETVLQSWANRGRLLGSWGCWWTAMPLIKGKVRRECFSCELTRKDICLG